MKSAPYWKYQVLFLLQLLSVFTGVLNSVQLLQKSLIDPDSYNWQRPQSVSRFTYLLNNDFYPILLPSYLLSITSLFAWLVPFEKRAKAILQKQVCHLRLKPIFEMDANLDLTNLALSFLLKS